MGGTFDPIHHGHLVAASEVAQSFDLDEVIFVPTGMPWQKDKEKVTAGEHRYLMTVIATASNPQFTVSRVDIDRAGPTYTIDTLRDLKSARPDAELFFITGADAIAQILGWRDHDDSGTWRTSWRCPGRDTSCPPRAFPRTSSADSRSPPWRSPPPTAVSG
jgi:nicotinate-nucleotide adenylyltransferase